VNIKTRQRRQVAIGQIARASVGPRWRFDFARLKTSFDTRQLDVPKGEQQSVAWEALSFAKGTSFAVLEHEKPPTWADVTSAHFHLWAQLLRPLKQDGACSGAWAGIMRLRPDGTISTQTRTDGLDFRRAFLYQAIELIRRQGERGTRLWFCPHCGYPFPAKRPDAQLCPGTSCRTLPWRRTSRPAFRKSRKAA
jgi:hypothetical protein